MKRIVVTGGAGFVGCNIAAALAKHLGQHIRVVDNFSREGAEENATWLRNSPCGNQIEIVHADIRSAERMNHLLKDASAVIHLAAQVAVTTSLENPVSDFEINARGTLNVLEAVRTESPEAPVLFASTNKVYGNMPSLKVEMRGARYHPADPQYAQGVNEEMPLDFHSPYGCSKGAAEQYVRDYARVFGLRTAVLRMSCIYGPRQFGTTDQGWVAHFMRQALAKKPITIFGDGYQVRDILHVNDAVRAWMGVLGCDEALQGGIFNLGGGSENAVSLRDVLARIEALTGRRVECSFDKWRDGDQPWYVSDTSLLKDTIGWQPRVTVPEGLASLFSWLTKLHAPA